MATAEKFAKTLNTELDKKGREQAKTNFATAGGPPDKMYISPNQAIPIVFVPGIMGSPLIATGKNTGFFKSQKGWAWFPDDWKWMGVTGKGYNNLSPAQRRILLDPANTKEISQPEEADTVTLRKAVEGKNMPFEEARRRGWGSVSLDSYGDILHFLENQLRFIFYQGHPYPGTYQAIPGDPATWGELSGYDKLDEPQLRKAAAWRYPVYAVGYNWLRSNRDAAEHLKNKVEEILNDCRTRMNLKCEQVILVSHSMGGLVTRMYAKNNPDRVLGIVHGVQPATGAGTAYRRVRAGWEDAVGAYAIGANAGEVSPVFANGAGPMELLPNHLYGNGWLRAVWGNGQNAQTLFSLPANGDPYGEIYRRSDTWWRLFDPAWVTVGLGNEKQIAKGVTLHKQKLTEAESFHRELGSYYHPNTFTHYGADEGKKAFHQLTWRLSPLRDLTTGLNALAPKPDIALNLRQTRDDLKGHCDLYRAPDQGAQIMYRNTRGEGVTAKDPGDAYRAVLDGQDNAGDGTVPGHSGQAPSAHSKFCAKMKGFGHQGSYDDPKVQALTLYSILKLAQMAKVIA